MWWLHWLWERGVQWKLEQPMLHLRSSGRSASCMAPQNLGKPPQNANDGNNVGGIIEKWATAKCHWQKQEVQSPNSNDVHWVGRMGEGVQFESECCVILAQFASVCVSCLFICCSIPTSLLSCFATTCCFVAQCLLHPYSPCLDDKNLSEAWTCTWFCVNQQFRFSVTIRHDDTLCLEYIKVWWFVVIRCDGACVISHLWFCSWYGLARGVFHISVAFIAAMPHLLQPVCPGACPVPELSERSPSWRCPPGCQHCFHMGRPTDLIPQTPLNTVYTAMCQAAIPHTPKRPRPVWCKEYTTEYLNEKFTKTTAKWQRRWQWETSCGGSWLKITCPFICHSNTCLIGTSFYFMWCVCMRWVGMSLLQCM